MGHNSIKNACGIMVLNPSMSSNNVLYLFIKIFQKAPELLSDNENFTKGYTPVNYVSRVLFLVVNMLSDKALNLYGVFFKYLLQFKSFRATRF